MSSPIPFVAITGAGYLGRRLERAIPGATLLSVDISDRQAVERQLDETKPAAVVNCAGKTGRPNVDWCETHQEETYRSNVVGALVLAEACRSRGIYLLHLGSGCIFYGPSPHPLGWREDDVANPTAFYSRTKYAADLVLSQLSGVGVARLRMPIDVAPDPRNLITKLAAYRQVVDVENSVTVVPDLIKAIEALVARRAEGVFHVTNPGTMRHRDLLELYRELVDGSHQATLIEESELVRRGLASKARSNCVLASQRLAEIGVGMRPIAVALRDTMREYAAHARQGRVP
jgi:dTDP-4-dehydrorhamnose reductase